MNTQTRRALVARLEEAAFKLTIGKIGAVEFGNITDATLREWGLEMAKIAAGAHDPTAADAVFTEVCVAVAENITAANDQQKGA